MQCWYCSEADMSPETDGAHEFQKCPNCGATQTELPGSRLEYGRKYDGETDMRMTPSSIPRRRKK